MGRSISVLTPWILAVLVSWASFAQAPLLRFEDFSKDPAWEGVNNRLDSAHSNPVVQDFGFSNTNYAGGKSPGEIGGLITRSLTKATYAKAIEEKTLEDRLTASGKFACTHAEGGSAMLFGWFNSKSDGWRTPNSLAFRLDGNGDKYWVFFEYGTQEFGTGGGETFEGDRYQTTSTPPERADGTLHEWSLTFDPAGAGGSGEMTFVFDGQLFTAALIEGHKEQGARFDRFGIFNQMTTGSYMNIYFDDLILDGQKESFDRDPQWEGVGNRTTFIDTIVRPFHDFGYRETQYAGGEKGELGGIVWRIENHRREEAGYYGDPIGTLTLENRLEASGKVAMTRAGADSAALIGWFNSKTFQEGVTPRNFLGILVEGPSQVGHYFRAAYMNDRLNGESLDQGPVIRPDGEAFEWSIVYDPEAHGGKGGIRATLGEESVDLPLKEGRREEGAVFDRFGMLSFLQGGHHVEIFFDDLTYTVQK